VLILAVGATAAPSLRTIPQPPGPLCAGDVPGDQ